MEATGDIGIDAHNRGNNYHKMEPLHLYNCSILFLVTYLLMTGTAAPNLGQLKSMFSPPVLSA